jgi:hypothetical protein
LTFHNVLFLYILSKLFLFFLPSIRVVCYIWPQKKKGLVCYINVNISEWHRWNEIIKENENSVELRFNECMQIMKHPFSPSSSILRSKIRFSPYLFTLLAFIIFVVIIYGEDFMCIFGQQLQNYSNQDKLYSTNGEFIRPILLFPINHYFKNI